MAFRGPRVWLWRWRRNPLKRRADTVEARVLLGTWLLTALLGVSAGHAAARSVENGMARERVEWTAVRGVLVEKAPGRTDRETADSRDRVWGTVRWVAPDGTRATGQIRVAPGSAAGTPVTVWTDRVGRLVSEPATAAEARLRATFVGGLVGLSAAAMPLVGGRLLCGRLRRHRLDRWDVAWAHFDPLGDRRTG
ncbi:Rv1733c family protein [Streptomyces griseoviridis]|uniref:Rv1733c family protein n=1 Tax=Streptomyces griseoviridis TaxID=45398 RepID=UPI0034380F6D